MSENFGKKIKQLRLKERLTLDELAERVGSKKAYIWQLENKAPARPSGKLLLDLARELKVSPDYLIDDMANEPTEEHLTEALLRTVKGRHLTKEEFEQLIRMADILAREDGKKSRE